jgi:histidinol-phosphate aminotransferase
MKISPEILNLVPYKPGKPVSEAQREFGLSRVVKLASNENPLGVSPHVLRAIEKASRELHRYPDPSCYELISAVQKVWSVPRERVVIGNGSNELIDLLIRIFCEPGSAILTTQGAFVAYEVCAQAARVAVVKAPLQDGFRMNLEAMAKILRADKEGQIRLIFLPNPNNPTGTIVSHDEVDRFLQEFTVQKDRLFIFDEAYHEFVRDPHYSSLIESAKTHEQVCVLRTMSKAYGLAGLRLGILVGPELVVDLVNRVRNPFNVSSVAQEAGIAALADQDFVRRSVELAHRGLDFFYRELHELELPFIESQGNFVMFDLQQNAQPVFNALLQQGVIFRPVANYGWHNHLRLSVGLEDENEVAMQALRTVLRK